MDEYISNLSPDYFSTSIWMRTYLPARAKNQASQKALQELGNLLENYSCVLERFEYERDRGDGGSLDKARCVVEGLEGKVRGWMEEMKKIK